jgi:hypothetical protein
MKEWLLLSEGHKPEGAMNKERVDDLFKLWDEIDAKREALKDD